MPERSSNGKRNVLLMYTGGAIGMRYREPGEKPSPLVPDTFEHLMESFHQHASTHALYDSGISLSEPKTPIKPKYSSNIGPHDWIAFAEEIYARREEVDGVVILHGTDTMVYTASALSFMFQHLPFPVVLTGAYNTISAPRSDAQQNMVTAIQIAACRDNEKEIPLIPEVCIFTYTDADRLLLRGNRAIEWNVGGVFVSPNYPPLGEASTEISVYEKKLLLAPKDKNLSLKAALENKIMYLPEQFPANYALLERVLEDKHTMGVLLEKDIRKHDGMPSERMVGLLAEAARQDKLVALVCNLKGGLQASPDVVKRLNDHGIATGGDMTAPAAIAKARYLLGNYSVEGARDMFGRNIRGELTGSLYQE